MLRICLALILLPAAAYSADPPANTNRGDLMIAQYFSAETHKLADACLAEINTLEDWTSRRDEYRRQLMEMLGLNPMPERTDLAAQVTGTVDHELFTVEKVHFQSRPGLYVTGNLYLPKALSAPAPAILYVCGHGRVAKDGVSYGNKTHYQHHACWFARHGYVCLIIDTLQLGEIEGIHHGTYKEAMWWWNARGYTPAGVEAWNCIRALDYLQSRPEIDGERIGVTGRSGGGAYSWWIAAIDERIKVAVPVAGITDLENHVVDGAVEGHCDCMFMLNTYRWDYAQVAALVAPRPLLISNTDKDGIFPLEGVVRVHEKARKIYRLYGAADKLGLHITEGGHKDTQELHIHAFHWFNRFLKGETVPIDKPAVALFEPAQLKVFESLPADQLNTRIHETFVPAAAPPTTPIDTAQWSGMRDGWMAALRDKVFRGWPQDACSLDVKPAFSAEHEGLTMSAYDFTSQEHIRLRLYVVQRAGLEAPERIVLNTLDESQWRQWLAKMRVAFATELAEETPPDADPAGFDGIKRRCGKSPWALVYFAPRGVGPTAWNQNPEKQIQHRRRFMLLGQTLEGMQTWDVRRAIQAVRELPGFSSPDLHLDGVGPMAGVALYASLFEPRVAALTLWQPPASHHNGPNYLNVLRSLDMPQAAAMVAERSKLTIASDNLEAWHYPTTLAKAFGWHMETVVSTDPGTP